MTDLTLRIVLVWLTMLECFAAVSAAVDVDRDGDIEAGIGYFNQGFTGEGAENQIYDDNPVQILQMQLDYVIRVHPRIAGAFDIHGDVNDLGLELRKAYVEIDVTDALRFRVGNMEKNLTIEEMAGRDDLVTVERSLLHEYLESFHILGYDFALESHVEHWEKRDLQVQSWTLAGVQGTRRIFGNLMAALDFSWGRVLLSDIFVYDSHHPSFTIGGAAVRFEKRRAHGELELFGGKDPLTSGILEHIGEKRAVYFAAGRALGAYAFPFEAGLIQAIEPLGSIVFIAEDIHMRDKVRAETLAGVNVHFHTDAEVRWMSNGLVRFASGPHEFLGMEAYAFYTQIQLSW